MYVNPILYALKFLYGFPLAYTIAIVDCLFSVGFSFIPSYIIKNIISCMTEYTDFNEFIFNVKPYIIFYIIFFLVAIIVFRLYDYIVCVKTFPQIKQNIIVEQFSYILNHSKNYFQENLFGDITEKIDDLKDNVVEILKWLFTKLFNNTLSIIASTSLLLYFNRPCGLVVLAWIMFFILLAIYFGKKIIFISRSWANKLSFLNGFMVDTLSNFIAVKIFNNVAHEKKIINNYAASIKDDESTIEKYFLLCWMTYAVSFFCVQVACFYILFNQYRLHLINASDFAFVWSINSSIVSILWRLLKDFVDLPEYYSSIEQSLLVLQKEIEIVSLTDKKINCSHAPRIVFHDVTFAFDDKIIFQNLNITIEPGEIVGIVGLSGSGKSTFINLLLRFYDIKTGQIFINDTDIKNITLDSLYDTVTIIPQDSFLFNRTILENITYGNHHATPEMIDSAIALANLKEFLDTLPLGIHTSVGNQGASLSGGQKQRIAIARAYLKEQASILILDEATSNLDSITEMKIQGSLEQVCRNKTTLIIAHRLSTLENVNRILVFHDGKIVQDGKHSTLIKEDGMYKKLWHMQINFIDQQD